MIIVLLPRSAIPSVWGWYAVDNREEEVYGLMLVYPEGKYFIACKDC
jgi:hypothetical protein